MKLIQKLKAPPLWYKFKVLERAGASVPDCWGLHSGYQQSYSLRRSTFTDLWTFPQIWQSIDALCGAGFRYEGHQDQVKCVWCGIVVGAWLPGEDPYDVHRLLSPECTFFLMQEESLLDISCDGALRGGGTDKDCKKNTRKKEENRDVENMDTTEDETRPNNEHDLAQELAKLTIE